LDHLTPLQQNLLKSLLDFVVAVGWACWERLMEWRDTRHAPAAEQNLPVLRLETWRVMLAKTPRSMRGELRLVRLVNKGVVAVLVPQSQMAERVRSALGARTSLCFTSTWAELKDVVACVSPSAIIADPLADERGDPVRHLAQFSQGSRIPVVLYTRLTPPTAGMLLRLGHAGIHDVIFYQHDDAPPRFAAAFDWGGRGNGPPLQAA
jgi:hypothetical protein